MIATLLTEKPVHVLLAGPPALAKSLFLWDIERACSEQAIWLVGSVRSKAGLWDLVTERQPRILLIDELDKMNASDTAALLSLMEGGRLVRAKKGRALDTTVPIQVLAATNQVAKLSPELKSRFAKRTLKPHDAAQYRKVAKGVTFCQKRKPPGFSGGSIWLWISFKLLGLCRPYRSRTCDTLI